MKTKDIPIEWDGKPDKVTIKKLTFGEINDIKQKAVVIRVVGNVPSATVNQKTLHEESIMKSLVHAPFTIGLKAVQDLDGETGEELWDECNEFSHISQEKKPKSPGPSGEEQTTPSSPEK
jgi:hypothetical protein